MRYIVSLEVSENLRVKAFEHNNASDQFSESAVALSSHSHAYNCNKIMLEIKRKKFLA